MLIRIYIGFVVINAVTESCSLIEPQSAVDY